MTNELDNKLRRTLAQCIDPTLFGGKEFIGPLKYGEPATEHPARFDVVRRKTPDIVKASYITGYLAQRVTEERGSLARAIQAAHEEFGLSPKTLEKEYWPAVCCHHAPGYARGPKDQRGAGPGAMRPASWGSTFVGCRAADTGKNSRHPPGDATGSNRITSQLHRHLASATGHRQIQRCEDLDAGAGKLPTASRNRASHQRRPVHGLRDIKIRKIRAREARSAHACAGG